MKILVCMFLAAVAFAAKPAQTVILKSSQLEVTFDPLKGLPVEYRLSSNKATIRGTIGKRCCGDALSREHPWLHRLRGSAGDDPVQQDARGFSVHSARKGYAHGVVHAALRLEWS